MKVHIYNVYTQLESESVIDDITYNQVKKLLTVKIEGANYSEAYKKGHWDGTKCFISAQKRFLTGFLPKVISEVLDKSHSNYELIDHRINLPQFINPIFDEFGTFKLRDYQFNAVQACNKTLPCGLYFPRGFIDAATNAGKSIIFGALINQLQDCKAIIFVHTKELFNQHYETFKPIFGNSVGRLNDTYVDFREFTIAMIQSTASKLKPNNPHFDTVSSYLNGYFNTVIVDECHRAGGNQYDSVLNQINAGVRLFFSGTPTANNEITKNYQVVGHSGQRLISISNDELIKLGVSRKPTVKIVENPTVPLKHRDFKSEMTQVIEDSEERTDLIVKLIKERPENYILVSCSKIEHGYKLYNAITSQLPYLNVAYIHGKSPDRVYRLQDFKSGKLEVLITSMIIKEGVNLPIIDTMIIAGGGKSTITVKQLCGRGLRAKEGKNEVEIIDFYDKGQWVESHSLARIKIYENEGFEIER